MFVRFLLYLLFCNTALFSQEGFLSAGGTDISNNGQVSYSIGLPFYTTSTGNGFTEEQGHQHAYATTIDKEGNAYTYYKYPEIHPNPAVDHVILTNNSLKLTTGTYQLIDLKGRVISSGILEEDQTYIPLKNMETAVYYLSILDGDENIAGFKVIKINE